VQGPCFVFGSNLAGIHGAGAARYAVLHHGAIMGQGIGIQGNSCAIPTKDERIETLPYCLVNSYIQAFIVLAKWTPGTIYHVTRIGCGLAGFSDRDIAPLFIHAPGNCLFSSAWKPWLPKHGTWTDA